MAVNADSGKIFELARTIIECYKKLANEVSSLDGNLISFGNTLDDETFSIIKGRVSGCLKELDDAKESVTVICQNLVKYAEIIEEANKAIKQ